MTSDDRMLLILTATAVNNWAYGCSPSVSERKRITDMLRNIMDAAMKDCGDRDESLWPPPFVSEMSRSITVTNVEEIKDVRSDQQPA
jgi:hypothetical protein